MFYDDIFQTLVKKGTIVPAKEVAPPPVPMDYAWARVSRVYYTKIIPQYINSIQGILLSAYIKILSNILGSRVDSTPSLVCYLHDGRERRRTDVLGSKNLCGCRK